AEARLLELANAYACLARLGEYRPYRLLVESHEESSRAASALTRAIDDYRQSSPSPWGEGRGEGELPSSDAKRFLGERRKWHPGVRVAGAGAAYLVADILSDNDAR